MSEQTGTYYLYILLWFGSMLGKSWYHTKVLWYCVHHSLSSGLENHVIFVVLILCNREGLFQISWHCPKIPGIPPYTLFFSVQHVFTPRPQGLNLSTKRNNGQPWSVISSTLPRNMFFPLKFPSKPMVKVPDPDRLSLPGVE